MKENVPFFETPGQTAIRLRDSLHRLVKSGKVGDSLKLLHVVTSINGLCTDLIRMGTEFAHLQRGHSREDTDFVNTEIGEMATILLLTSLTGITPTNNYGQWERTEGVLPCIEDFKGFRVRKSLDRRYWHLDGTLSREEIRHRYEYPLEFTLEKIQTAKT